MKLLHKKNFSALFKHIEWRLLLYITLLIIYGLFILHSANGHNFNMLNRKLLHVAIGFILMLAMAQIPPRTYQLCAPYLYILCIFLLVLVLAIGDVSKGARRWLTFFTLRFQPSELAKLIVPLMLANFINRYRCPPTLMQILWALLLVATPAVLVALQPDLGTAILIATSGLLILFLSGVSWRMIGLMFLLTLITIPILWHCFLHDYQRARLLTLFNPERDPLNTGYHIIQSKIAIGSGGLWGKGWLQGTQSQLEFLPERHTDFIFAVLAEELGLIGVICLLLFYCIIIFRGLFMAIKAQNAFNYLLIGSYILIFFLYIFINIGMVSGLFPVVGIPLPLVSYGGTSTIVLMASFGIIMSLHTHRTLFSYNI